MGKRPPIKWVIGKRNAADQAMIGWHGWMKAAGAINGRPRELRHTMPSI
jgi:hypothetical protein